MVQRPILKIDPSKFILKIQYLIDHCRASKKTPLTTSLYIQILGKIGLKFPNRMVWYLANKSYSCSSERWLPSSDDYLLVREMEELSTREDIKRVFSDIRSKLKYISRKFDFAKLFQLSKNRAIQTGKLKDMVRKHLGASKIPPNLMYPSTAALYPDFNRPSDPDNKYSVFREQPVFITEFNVNSIVIFKSKERPMMVQVTLSDGTERGLIIKDLDLEDPGNDIEEQQYTTFLRKMANLFSGNGLRPIFGNLVDLSYTIITTGRSMVIEVRDSLETLTTISRYGENVFETVSEDDIDPSIIKHIKLIKSNGFRTKKARVKKAVEITKKQKCLLNFYFFTKNGGDYLLCRDNFWKSYSFWALVGYITGLGDRHLSNIAVNSCNGTVQFFDFELIFGYGKNLPVKEKIEIRLTPIILNFLGQFREKGLLKSGFLKLGDVVEKDLEQVLHHVKSICYRLSNRTKRSLTYAGSYIEKIKKYFCEFTESEADRIFAKSSVVRNYTKMYHGWDPMV